jgi:hypothetical protein
MKARLTIALLCLAFILVIGVPTALVAVFIAKNPAGNGPSGGSRAGVAVEKLPPLARAMVPLLDTLVGAQCPELSVLRVVAEVQAESGWNERAWSEDSNGGAAGLLQINQANWLSLGGQTWRTTPPPDEADIFDARTHLALGVNFLCGNLRAMADYLGRSGKSLDPLDAMSVCHIAGCGRVVGSRTGIPEPGEAGCEQQCVNLIRRYLDNIHRYEQEWAVTSGPSGSPGMLPAGVDVTGIAAPQPFTGGPSGCDYPDPTSSGCLTAATRNGILEVQRVFGAEIRSAGCWAARPSNPSSDHPKGRGCDLFPDRNGIFPSGAPLLAGWQIAALAADACRAITCPLRDLARQVLGCDRRGSRWLG